MTVRARGYTIEETSAHAAHNVWCSTSPLGEELAYVGVSDHRAPMVNHEVGHCHRPSTAASVRTLVVWTVMIAQQTLGL